VNKTQTQTIIAKIQQAIALFNLQNTEN